MTYSQSEHAHRFAAWAAARAASTKTARFKVSMARHWIELIPDLSDCKFGVGSLPRADRFDEAHRCWRAKLIASAQNDGVTISHGTAAKLINVYLKALFLTDVSSETSQVKVVHPPIDRLLIDELARERPDIWRGHPRSWSKFDSDLYERTIEKVRETLEPQSGLWRIEAHWSGFQ